MSSRLTLCRNAALLCSYAYNPTIRPTGVCHAVGESASCTTVREGDVLAMVVDTPTRIYVVFRGTWLQDRNSARRNFRAHLTAEDFYRVHEGFADGLREVWSDLLQVIRGKLKAKSRPVVIAGHSQGGALAEIAAVRLLNDTLDQQFLQLSEPPRLPDVQGAIFPDALITFGAPRAGDWTYSTCVRQLAQSSCFVARFTNVNDCIPFVPPWSWGYQHGSPEWFLPGGQPRMWVAPGFVVRTLHNLWNRIRTQRLHDSLHGHRASTYAAKLQALPQLRGT